MHWNILIIVTELIDIESVNILNSESCLQKLYFVKVSYLNMFHEVPRVIKVLAAGGAGDHIGHAAVVQSLGVGLALAGEPQLAVVALVCDQACDGVKTHSTKQIC